MSAISTDFRDEASVKTVVVRAGVKSFSENINGILFIISVIALDIIYPGVELWDVIFRSDKSS